MEKFAGAVIISFNTIKEKEEFLNHIPNSFFLNILKMIAKLRYFFCICCVDKIDNSMVIMKYLKLDIEEAPIPEDIIFENLEFTPQSKVYRVVGINMISLILILIGFAINFGLQHLQINVKKKDYNNILIYYIISICINIASSIINIIFEELLDMLTRQEKQNSVNNVYLSYSIKLTIFSFLTKGIIPLVVEKILRTNNYEVLITNMFTTFLTNSILPPLIWTFNINPIYWFKQLEIYLIEKDEKKYLNMNQKNLNELYEKIDMNIAEKYSYIAKTLLMTFLYISIFPFGVLISLIGFILCFFLEKYNYINNYKRPEVLNNTLFFFYLEFYSLILFVIGIGDYIFLSNVFNNKNWSLVNLVFLVLFIIIPYNYFLKQDFIGFKESEINDITYEDAYLDFNKNYDRMNPMTSKEGTKDYIAKLYEKGFIDEDQRDQFNQDLDKINLMKIYNQNRNQRNKLKLQKSLVSINKDPISKSVLPNKKNLFKLSSIFKSFISPRSDQKRKTVIGINRVFNHVGNINKENYNNNNLTANKRVDITERINNLVRKEDEIKEENYEEKESEKEEEKEKLQKTKGFYENTLMNRICGYFEIYEYLNRNRNQIDEINSSENEEDNSEEIYEDKSNKNRE